MKLERLPHDPRALLDIYEEGLNALGSLCERTWHDRLHVIAEGKAAGLWREDGALHEVELRFAAAETTSARDASREVFPGCPLTFRLTEALRPFPMPLERLVLSESSSNPPHPDVMEKLWRAQFPNTGPWRLASPPAAEFHISLLALMRCEIQALDQHWSLHRIAVSLADGAPDDALARDVALQGGDKIEKPISWPQSKVEKWRQLLQGALERELENEIKSVRARQETSLRREIERIDDYFETYERELTARTQRSSGKNTSIKMVDRLAAAKAEHERRRHDQIARHEIRVIPHIDALSLVAEKAWRASINVGHVHQVHSIDALFIPRLRLWKTVPSERI